MSRLFAAVGMIAFLCHCGDGTRTAFPLGGIGGGLVQAGGTGGVAGSTFATGTNTLDVTVDPGPQDIGYTNGLSATVTLCVPGTTTCQTFDHLLVDTGSVGVRVLESEL